jgi:type IV pilus assembly protein PilC
VVVSLTEVRTPTSVSLQKFSKIKIKDLSMMCRQFSIILKSGLPLVQAVDLVAGQTEDKNLKHLLHQVAEDVSNGWSLSYSFTQRGGKKLPATFIETVRSGEESGDLVKAFTRMSTYYDRMHKTRSKATSAMVYPAFVMIVAVIVVAIIMIYAVPTFASTFEGMGIDLPIFTVILITVSTFMANYWWLLGGIIAVLVIGLLVYKRTEKGALQLSKIWLKIPLLGKIGLMSACSQFAHTMTTMLSSGMPILQALEVSGRSVSNVTIAKAIQELIPGVESGNALGDCMAQRPELPEMLTKMTAVGEATGSMESVLEVVAEFYDNRVDNLTAKALSLLEPAIIVFLAGFVVIILLAIYLPMFSMYGSI